MKLEEMKEIASHIDFKEDMTKLECFLNNLGYSCMMLP